MLDCSDKTMATLFKESWTDWGTLRDLAGLPVMVTKL